MQREGREQWQVLHAKIEHLLQQRQAMVHNIEEEVPRAEAAYHESVKLFPAILPHVNDDVRPVAARRNVRRCLGI